MTEGQDKKRIGRPRKDTERRERAWFSVSADDMRWLHTLPNRSEWLRQKIDLERISKHAELEQSGSLSRSQPTHTDTPPQQDAE